jgi:hypothetical protein
MTAYIVFVALGLSIYVIRHQSLEKAFLYVWIPLFILMPDSFYVDIPGLPDPSFMQAAIIPIVIGLMLREKFNVHLGLMEWLIASYMLFRVIVDYNSRGYYDAQNYTFYLLTSALGPYLLGRYLIKTRTLDIDTAKIFVLMFIIMFPMLIFELKYWVTPIYKLLAPLFPNAQSGLSMRYGIARVHGSFTHPILACIMILIAYRLHRWLTWKGVWNQTQDGLLGVFQRVSHKVSIPMSSQISIMLLLAAILTISRGPWLGGLFGAVIAAIGHRPNPKRVLYVVIPILLFTAGVGGLLLNHYLSPSPGTSLSYEAGTLLYRKSLLDRYIGFVMERPFTGWGLTTTPRQPGMESIDNGFLLMALEHGLPAMLLFIAILVYAIISQISFAITSDKDKPAIGFTFAGIYVMCFIAFATVYLGAQTMPMIFLLLGWGESIRKRDAPVSQSGVQPAAQPPPFKRVIF